MTAQTDNSTEHRILIAGFGGQGILTLGKLLCNAAISEGKNVTYMPSYGTEVRGGTCNCHVVVSPEEIFSPYVEAADSLIILNELSYERFRPTLRRGGLMVLNTSMVDPETYEGDSDAHILGLPATETAGEMGNVLVANVLLLGVFIGATGLCEQESIEQAIREWLGEGKEEKIPLNLKAFRQGIEAGRQSG
jgi:2-oxoglutarate ferredoxin oxidoreductase subunit gamma